MEKLTSNYIYCDYNATAPLSESVIDLLKGASHLPFANPSSIHTLGKESRKQIENARKQVLDIFNLADSHELFFHSGATEGQAILSDLLFTYSVKNNERFAFIYSPFDHPSIHRQAEKLSQFKELVDVYQLPVLESGLCNVERSLELISNIVAKDSTQKIMVNYTFVQSETGIIWPLEDASKLKINANVFVLVDSVQSVGKIKKWNHPTTDLDAYTYSGHKFGALKGIGFTFIKKEWFRFFKTNSSQEYGLRGGSENLFGVLSIPLALNDLVRKIDVDKTNSLKILWEQKLLKTFAQKDFLEIVGLKQNRISNTTLLMTKGIKNSLLLPRFDRQELMIGTGSACSSGITLPSKALIAMGYSEAQAKSVLRFSFDPFVEEKILDEVLKRLLIIFDTH